MLKTHLNELAEAVGFSGFDNEASAIRLRTSLVVGVQQELRNKRDIGVMQTGNSGGVGFGHRYSAKKTVVPVNFLCVAPEASQVVVVGDFNDWDPSVAAMKKGPDGSWHASLPIHSGHHRYRFLVDGEPQLDPRARGVVKMEDDSKASLLSVS